MELKCKIKLFFLGLACLFIFPSPVLASEKALVVYYSLTGNTKAVCELISKELGADLIEIKDLKNDAEAIKKVFPGGMMTMKKDKAPVEMKEDKPAMPKLIMDTEISPLNINFSKYSQIVIGSPIWMGKLAPAVSKLLNSYRLENKKVVLLTTSNAIEKLPIQEAYKDAVRKSGAEIAAYYQVKVRDEQKVDLTRDEIMSEAKKLIPVIKAAF